MIKKFKTYSEQSELRNESVRDMMKPKSDKDISNSLDQMSYPLVGAKLIYASQEGDIGWVKILLDKGVSPNFHTQLGTTPLMFAVMKSNVELVKLLLSRGAKVNIKNENGRTALDIARTHPEGIRLTRKQEEDGQEIIRLLVSHNKTNESVRDKMTPKSEKEIDDGLDKLLREIANRLKNEGGFKSYIRAYSELKNSLNYIIDKREDGWSADELFKKFSKKK